MPKPTFEVHHARTHHTEMEIFMASMRLLIPSDDFFAVTPHATNKLARKSRSLYIGGGGGVDVVNDAGVTVTFLAVPAGATIPVQTWRVLATTTATSIVAY